MDVQGRAGQLHAAGWVAMMDSIYAELIIVATPIVCLFVAGIWLGVRMMIWNRRDLEWQRQEWKRQCRKAYYGESKQDD